MWLRHLSNDFKKKKKKKKKVLVLSGLLQLSALNLTFCEVGNIFPPFFFLLQRLCVMRVSHSWQVDFEEVMFF